MCRWQIVASETSVRHPNHGYTKRKWSAFGYHAKNTGSSSPSSCRAFLGSTHLPKVLDDFVGLCIPPIVRMFLPIFDVNVGNATDKKLEFALVKDIDEL